MGEELVICSGTSLNFPFMTFHFWRNSINKNYVIILLHNYFSEGDIFFRETRESYYLIPKDFMKK
jgi:hypothetical protein